MPIAFGDCTALQSTAKMVSYWRQFSNIPFARRVSELSHARAAITELLGPEATAHAPPPWVLFFIEARYKSIVRAVDQYGIKQILELASGFALRGLATLLERDDLVYVETDLPAVHEEKLGIVQNILGDEARACPAGLHFFAANALVMDELLKACQVFDLTQPLAIVHEGLAQYLNFDEKRLLAGNIGQLLARYGGVWITPDLEANEAKRRRHADAGKAEEMAMALAKVTGRHLNKNSFETTAAMMAFMHELGFVVTPSPLIDDSMVLSTLADPAERARVDAERAHICLWHCKLAT